MVRRDALALSPAGVASRWGAIAAMDQRDGEEATKNSLADRGELHHFLHTCLHTGRIAK